MPRMTEEQLAALEATSHIMGWTQLTDEIRALQQDVARSEEVIAIAVQQRDAMVADRAKLLEALKRAELKLTAYVGVCKDDKELNDTVLPMARAVIEEVER